MQEFRKIRQDRSGFKRYFYDDTLDLYVWYDCQGGKITGFQLVYDKKTVPRALTWIKDKGFRHNKIEGDDSSYFIQTPILVADGIFNTKKVAELFLEHGKGIDEDISSLVLATVQQYDPNLDDQFI
jgi:hypothetical protein